jgi:hypothetical protein
LVWRSWAAVISHRSLFAGTNYIDAEAARAILFTALCEGIVLDDGDLARRVKDRLASMPESSAWPIPEHRQQRHVEPTIPITGRDMSRSRAHDISTTLDSRITDALSTAA